MERSSILILYASETGNSQDIADDLEQCAQRLRFNTRADEMNNAQLSWLVQYDLVIFVVSTTGQGDVPRNGTQLWRKLLRRKLAPGSLRGVNFTTFGLGDSSYPKFNWAARKLNRRLLQLGADEVLQSGEADERHDEGTDGLYLRWLTTLREWLLEKWSVTSGQEPIPDEVALPARFPLVFRTEPHEAKAPECEAPSQTDKAHLPIPGSRPAVLQSNERITPPGYSQDVRHIVFDVLPDADGTSLNPNPGDTITIFPQNQAEDVETLIKLMGWASEVDKPIDRTQSCWPPSLHITDKVPPPGSTITLRDLLLRTLDITAVPRRSFLKRIAHFATANEDHRGRLLEFAGPDYVDEYYDYTTRPRRTILEVLHEFDSVRVPAGHALDTFPLLRGREFSIANHVVVPSSPSSSSPARRVEIMVALVRYKTILRKERRGLCSRYLDAMEAGAQITVLHKPTPTPKHGPEMSRRPLVGIATGTGLAPIRALIWERASHCQKNPSTTGGGNGATTTSPPPPPATVEAVATEPSPSSSSHLFFGFRNRSADFYFSAEWPSVPNLVVHPAESRPTTVAPTPTPAGGSGEGEGGRGDSSAVVERTYVQDVILREAILVADLVRRRAIFFVCGGSHRMARAVRDAVVEAAGREMGITAEAERDRLFDELEWVQEIW